MTGNSSCGICWVLYTFFGLEKVRLPVAAQLHAKHRFTGMHFPVLQRRIPLVLKGFWTHCRSGTESMREQNLEHMSLEHDVLCCGMQWPRANVYNSLGGMEGFKSLCTSWQWALTFACFQSSSQLNPLGAVCTGVSKRKYLALKVTSQEQWVLISAGVPQKHWTRKKTHILSAIRPKGMSGAPESGFRCMLYSTKWQFPSLQTRGLGNMSTFRLQ